MLPIGAGWQPERVAGLGGETVSSVSYSLTGCLEEGLCHVLGD